MTTRLSLICHAPTSANRAFAFPADEPLDARALKKRSEADSRLDAERYWTSPALRAVQTAEFLGLHVTAEARLRECDYGRWSGRSLEDVQADEPEAVMDWMRDPTSAPHGGESTLALIERVASWLDGQNGMPGRVIAVTHASVIRAAIIHALDGPPKSFARIDVAPLSLVRLSGHAGRWNLVALGERIG